MNQHSNRSSPSPMTRSTRTPSPLTKVGGPTDTTRESTRAFSPLRAGRTTTDDVERPPTPNGNAKPLSKPASLNPATSDAEPQEFPFPVPSTDGVDEQNPKSPISGNGTVNKPPSIAPISRKPTAEGGTITPTGRRSVQFARSATFGTSADAHSRQQSWDTEDIEGKGKQGSSLMSKLKALATPISLQGHSRSLSAYQIGEEPPTPAFSERNEVESGNEADADEDSAGEGPSRPPRRRRKSRRLEVDGTQTAPTTPKTTGQRHFFRQDSPGTTPTSATAPRQTLFRRATMTDIPEHQRQGYSEDEGRDRLEKESAWKRGLHSARGLSYAGIRGRNPSDAEHERRPSNLRRLTGFGSAGGEGAPSPWLRRSERTSSVSAQKWQKIKAGLIMLGQRSKAERQIDHTRSAELMAELLAGAPAALFLASMFQRDEHGHKRIPVLLEQLKLNITDSDQTTNKVGDRHAVFRIELEYGSGLTRMKWVIHRTLRDFANLHVKYKVQEQTDRYLQLSRPSDDPKRAKLPRFPRSALPYLRGIRGYGQLDEEEEEANAAEASGADAEASGPDGPPRAKRRQSSWGLGRRKSSIGSPQNGTAGEMAARSGSFAGAMGAPNTKMSHNERQRKKLENYIHQLITYFIFRPDSNRLCKFLELSALGVRLAAEGGYHGKEGFMMIKSGDRVDFRKKWTPALVQRHKPKWFLVRHSYVVCVDSPEEMNVHEVFLVDSNFLIEPKTFRLRDRKAKDIASEAKTSATHPNHHQLRLVNAERRLKLLAKNERQLQQFEDSINFMKSQTIWSKVQRFGSFAPVRKNVYAQWLVDGRDYMWNVSRAINMARDVIYIHDWWLSPELYMRRPPAISQKWRLDRLLQKKAQEGVKIFVIMYRNINSAIPIDSTYSKFSLLDLHPNVFVQRSPNQIRQNTFFWAHHEKICVIDHAIAFCGGVDLCFGRWDTPQHILTDDKLTGFENDDIPKDGEHCQLWPGKDYSNPRVHDFYDLDKPYDEMYDRTKTPRMPWHDIGMQIVGQPARDLTRHFVQRWNYLLRQRKPSRPTPLLLPPPDFVPADIEALGLDGTCEIQILRSASSWSIGTPDRTEHSIMTAYVQMITTSEHFVYIENQFFITSCEVNGTKIANQIGDALVDRIKRAHANDELWRACIVIPLMPGFQNTVDAQDGSSVRLIMTCQYCSICRGEKSIFGRLRAAGIEPEDYIQFYSLRNWGAIGPTKTLTTEQVYIHAKVMVVDDRVAIIGSANINERSMLGSRDSEVAAIVRDTELMDSHMGGEPYKVGRFPHTLRVRLMREHLGLDVDSIAEDECGSQQDEVSVNDFRSDDSMPSSPTQTQERAVAEQKMIEVQHAVQDDLIAKAERLHSFNHDVDWEQENNPRIIPDKKHPSSDPRVMNNKKHEKDVRGEGPDHMLEVVEQRPSMARGRDSTVDAAGHEVLLSDVAPEHHLSPKKPSGHGRERSNTTGTRGSAISSVQDGYAGLPPPRMPRMDTTALGLTQLSQLPSLPLLDDTDIGGPPLTRAFSQASFDIIAPLLAEMRRPIVTNDCVKDPLNDAFYLDTWHAAAENNTKIYRQVFRCMPDNEVKDWKQYREYAAFSERFQQSQGGGKSTTRRQQESQGKDGPPGTGATAFGTGISLATGATGEKIAELSELGQKITEKLSIDKNNRTPMGTVGQWAEEQESHVQSQVQSPAPMEPGSIDEKVAIRDEDGTFEPTVAHPQTSTEEFGSPQDASVRRARAVTYAEPARTGTVTANGTKRGRRRATTKSSARAFHAADDHTLLNRNDAEKLLNYVQGHLVVFPYDWLVEEDWFFSIDQIAPLEIYN